MAIAAAVIAVAIAAISISADFWVNWWWFGSIGYRSVLVARYAARAVSFLIGGGLAGIFVWANLRFALRPATLTGGAPARPPSRLTRATPVAAGVWAGAIVGGVAASRWETWLLLWHGREFGLTDPTLGRDVGFYVFTLPALNALRAGAFALVIVVLAAVAAIHALRTGLRPTALRRPPPRVASHLGWLGAAALLLIAAASALGVFGLAYSTRGGVFGPGYTDVMVSRPAGILLALLAVAASALVPVALRRGRWRPLLAVGGAWAIVAVVLGGLAPAAVQQTVVEGSELSRERTYIERNIAMTRAAFDLDRVRTRDLSGEGEPEPATLAADGETFANLRLWDYRVIQSTYQQLRSFVPYYRFDDVDIDRYEINGRTQQVLIAVRELDTAGLPSTAQTWVNRHLVYTHGYGVVVSPVNEATPQGLPEFLVGSIPPEGAGLLTLNRPEVYFGETATGWVAVGTKQSELNGLPGETDLAPYQGAARGSVGLDGYLPRLMLAAHLGDRRVILSAELTGSSRVLLRRDIVERAEAIAPFLSYDPDPYPVIADGRLVWLIDAYTTTDRFPSATPIEGLSYIRHAAKVAIDAYDGTTTFYRTAVPDPIADAYGAAFSDLFTPIAEASPALTAHFRYPERLFNLQSDVYGTYHVEDATAFYNGEDRWGVPLEQVTGERNRMEAYYVTVRPPEEPASRFGLVIPFVPAGREDRQNMTAWLSGATDATGQADLLVYRFPRQVTVFGPEQVAARITQDPDIKNQTALLGQAGSEVITGNMLVIPVGQTVLYVQPLYVRATATASAPTELKFVIVATNERVVMRPTLTQALAALTTGVTPPSTAEPPVTEPPAATDPTPEIAPLPDDADADLAARALAAYERGQAALRAEDLVAYGREQALLGAILRQLMDDAPGGQVPATPAATPES